MTTKLQPTAELRIADGGRVELDVWTYDDPDHPRAAVRITADTPKEAVRWAGGDMVGVVLRRGRAVRHGEVQHGPHVILVPEHVTLAELAEDLIAGRFLESFHSDPVPQVIVADVWRWLRNGLMDLVADNPDMNPRELGCTDYAMFVNDGETGELVILDYRLDGGITATVVRGELKWNLPLGGSAPELV